MDDETRSALSEIRRRLAALEAFRWIVVGAVGVLVALVVPVVLDRIL